LEFLLCTLTPGVQCRLFHRNHVIWRTKITKCWRNGNDSKQPYWNMNLNIFCKRQISIKLFYLYQRLQCRDKYFFKIKFVFFLYLPLCIYFWYQTDSGNTVVSNHVNSYHVPSFSCLDVWTNRQGTSGVYAITVTTSAYHSRRCGRL
jgi:hypothetical protein